MNHRTGNTCQGLHLGALYHGAFSNNTIQYGGVELNGPIQVSNGQSDVIEGTHGALLRRGRSRAKISSSVSCRLMSADRFPVTRTVAGRVRALKLEAAASWYAPVSRNAITSPHAVAGAS